MRIDGLSGMRGNEMLENKPGMPKGKRLKLGDEIELPKWDDSIRKPIC